MFRQQTQVTSNGHNHTNLTPLIDVSLVLVVILLLATPLAFESSIAVRSAVSSGQTAASDDGEARIEVTVVSEDSVRVNRAVVSRTLLGETLRPLLATGAPRVVVTCTDDVSHGAFVNVLDQAKLSGAVEIGFMGR
jgi:biopolymer transport protein ExbD